jgi:hypothetical protein
MHDHTDGTPESRLDYLGAIPDWNITYKVVGETRFMYTCQAKP